MFILSNFLYALAKIISLLITIYTYIIIARVFTSWVSANPYNPIVRTLYFLTEPVLSKIRKIIPFIPVGAGYIDLSPIILILLLQFLDIFIVKTLSDIAFSLRGY
ncbi:MAG: YggT family protein [Proteobacteria bacterium]|nr:YggT family protein [Pseudomonadota bacterium]